jgi:hypothetical protein
MIKIYTYSRDAKSCVKSIKPIPVEMQNLASGKYQENEQEQRKNCGNVETQNLASKKL